MTKIYIFRGSYNFRRRFGVRGDHSRRRLHPGEQGIEIQQLVLPPFMKHWNRWQYRVQNTEEFATTATTGDRSLRWMPDVFSAYDDLLVSEKARDAIERIAPGAHQYAPATVTTRTTGEHSEKKYFRFICSHVFAANVDDPLLRHPVDFMAGHLNREFTELFRNTKAFNYFSNIPFWQNRFNTDQLFFSADAYEALKAEGVIGIDTRLPTTTRFTQGVDTVSVIDNTMEPLEPTLLLKLPKGMSKEQSRSFIDDATSNPIKYLRFLSYFPGTVDPRRPRKWYDAFFMRNNRIRKK